MCAAVLIMALAPLFVQAAAPAANPFDGAWIATVSCPNTEGAMGYVFDVPITITGGAAHGQRLKPGEPGWLKLDGRVDDDGQAELDARGLVGAAPFAVGHQPRGTEYGYHVEARFEGDSGSGRRIEGRPCALSFVRRWGRAATADKRVGRGSPIITVRRMA